MSTLDRTLAPPFQLSSNYSLVQPEIFHLSQGIKFFAFRGLQQEAVKLELIFDAGKWHESKLGISHFTSQMLSKGTQKRNSFQIAEAIDSLGAHLEISPGFDTVSLALFALRKNLAKALSIVVELLKDPAFDSEELRLMKDIFLQSLKVNNEKASVVASKEIRKAIFGKEHPYGSAVEEEDVRIIEQKHLQTFFHDHFSLQSVFLVGRLSDVEMNEVIAMIPAMLPQNSVSENFDHTPGESLSIAKPGSVQASIRLGKTCLPKSDSKDHFDAVMFNHVFGGYFGSRLMKNIREEKGLTYGIHSSMHHFLHDSFWVISAEVNLQNADKAVEEIRNEVRKLQEVPMPLDELEVARNYFIGSWQSENSTLFSVAERINAIQLWGLSENYYSNLLEHIQKITPIEIQSAANAYFDGSDLIEIQVG